MQIREFLGESERKALILTVEPLSTSSSCTVACFLLALPIHTYFSCNPSRRCKAPEIYPHPHLYVVLQKIQDKVYSNIILNINISLSTRSTMKLPAAVTIRSLCPTSSTRLVRSLPSITSPLAHKPSSARFLSRSSMSYLLEFDRRLLRIERRLRDAGKFIEEGSAQEPDVPSQHSNTFTNNSRGTFPPHSSFPLHQCNNFRPPVIPFVPDN
jgi:hypothetical protein